MAGALEKALTKIVSVLVGRIGLNVQGAMILDVRGRRTGRISSRLVNPLLAGGERYLLSPQGEVQWVKNIRVSGTGMLRRGRHAETFGVEEVPDVEKLPILRAYLDRWSWQVKSIMGVNRHSSDDDLRRVAPAHPVFRIVPTTA